MQWRNKSVIKSFEIQELIELEFPSKLKQFLQSEIHMDQHQLSSQRSSLSPLPTITSDTTCSMTRPRTVSEFREQIVRWKFRINVFIYLMFFFDFRVGRHVTIVTMLWWSERAMAKKKFEMCDDQCWLLLWVTKLFKS